MAGCAYLRFASLRFASLVGAVAFGTAILIGSPLGVAQSEDRPTNWKASTVAQVAITIKPDADIRVVENKLIDAGFLVQQRLREIGSIVGRTEREQIPRLREVPGVEDVSELPPIHIAPPDSEIQ